MTTVDEARDALLNDPEIIRKDAGGILNHYLPKLIAAIRAEYGETLRALRIDKPTAEGTMWNLAIDAAIEVLAPIPAEDGEGRTDG